MKNEVTYSFKIDLEKRVKEDRWGNFKIFKQTKKELDHLNKIRNDVPIVACLKENFMKDGVYTFYKEHWILVDDSFSINVDSNFYFRVAEREEYIMLTLSWYLAFKDCRERLLVYKKYRSGDPNWYLDQKPQWDFEKYDYKLELVEINKKDK